MIFTISGPRGCSKANFLISLAENFGFSSEEISIQTASVFYAFGQEGENEQVRILIEMFSLRF